MDRKELVEAPDRPLLAERFAGLIDTVSGVMFARSLAQLRYGGAAAVCGLAAGPAFPGSILPFILRGITVYGIDSVMMPKGPREEAWQRLAHDLPFPKILKGEIRGRVVVDVNK
jgi:acrylyl-CoA reductase (NADPH)